MTDGPPTATLESVWFVEATYAPDGSKTRLPFRAEHLARCVDLLQQGVFVEVGAFKDVSASVMLVRAETESAALDIVRQDVYLRNGVWVELRARPFGRVVQPRGELG